ncbi:hypothetical protein H5392_08775 [Tessaracoccus sp. MC1865]|uniref:hypothetical protein n=1 Tax=Tessaracoccus sp. MC1865 TaxID=2760310 RepID=UPI0016033228|nr:hypothetical protein [Tessaracoccus sp. MC1865]MBB1483951.1 hypothetical protein [Tessaracoccus sp. MC1865]QTO36999.1 hypothetical protein J7D54_11145 [Tessaracoccus sp. MC1865]
MKWIVIALAVGAALFGLGFIIAATSEGGFPWSWWWVIPVGATALVAWFGMRIGTQKHIEEDVEHEPIADDEHPPAL